MSRPELPPGIHLGVGMGDYLALPYASASGLELLDKSPKKYRHALEHPIEETPAMRLGTALHLAVLEPDTFGARYIVIGRCEGRKKDGERCQYQGSTYRDGQSFCGTHDPAKGEPLAPGVVILEEPARDDVVGMADAIRAHARGSSLFDGAGAFEATVVFDDPATGVRVKIRPDRLVDRAGMLVELKSTRDASDRFFPKDSENRGYFRKLALYRRGLRAAGFPYKSAAVLAVESEAPYDLVPYLVDEGDLDGLEGELDRLLALYAECSSSGVWPGYAEEFQLLRRPAWARNRDEFSSF